MLAQSVLLAVLMALKASALPLNINLGAYSPALVVGDGEISFGGNAEGAAQVLQTLSSGAANGAVANGAQGAQPGQIAPSPIAPAGAGGAEGARPPQAGEAGGITGQPAPAAGEQGAQAAGVASPIVGNVVPAAESAAPPVAQALEANIQTPALDAQLPAEYISHAVSSATFPKVKQRNSGSPSNVKINRPQKRFISRPAALSNPQVSSNAIKKRSTVESSDEIKKRALGFFNEHVKRDFQGFMAALQFAKDAQLTQPRVEMGFDLIQNAGLNVPVNSAANGLPRMPEKRSVDVKEEKRDEAKKMTLIAIQEI